MKCKNCNTTNSPSALKCTNCNAPLKGSMVEEVPSSGRSGKGSVVCKNCRSQNPVNALKCGQCNAPLAGSMVIDDIETHGLSDAQVQCRNCKSVNPADVLKCHNCNAPLDGSMVLQPKVRSVKKMEDSTVAFRPDRQDGRTVQCAQCFYPNTSGTLVCVQCGQELSGIAARHEPEIIPSNIKTPKASPPKKASSMTVNPWLEQPKKVEKFSLIPLEADGKTECPELRFAGLEIELKRDNLDPGNNTITSDIQAFVTFEDGTWSIENKSVMETTFIRVNGKIALQDGDVILVGNKLFRFKS